MTWKFKKNMDVISTSDFWYDLTEGYIEPENILSDKKQIQEVEDAIDLLENFRDTMLTQERMEYN